MQSMPQYALVGSILASVVGALVMCVLVFRYGFTVPPPSDAEDGRTPTEVLVTRVGHAVAGACFAATAVLAIAGLALRTPGPVAAPQTRVAAEPAAPATAVTALDATSDVLLSRRAEEVQALEARLAEAEAQLARLDHEVNTRSARATAPVAARPVAEVRAPSSAVPPVPAPAVPASAPKVTSVPVASSVPSTSALPGAPASPGASAVPSGSSPTPAAPVVVSTPPPALPVPTYSVPVTPQISTVTDEPAPSGAALPSRAATSSPSRPAGPRSKDLLATARQELDTARERASGFIDDVRAAYSRTERTLIQRLGNDPQGRVSARD